jgi:LacI family transcriptional regulator
MKVTLKDIAQMCGCSITSVSRALKNSDTISKELREKVQATTKELGYVPNLLAGSMRRGYTNTIAMILQDLRNPFYSLLAKYVEEYASSLGYTLIIMTTSESSEREYECVINAMQKGVDGILYLPIQHDARCLDILKKNSFPFVLVGRIFDGIESDYVVVDDKKGAYLAVDHLIKKGHKKILFLNTFMNIYSAQERYTGYQDAFRDNDLSFNSNDNINISMDLGETQKAINSIFEKNAPYTSIFCFCDLIALEAIYSLRQLGLKVPDDVAVASNDDINSDIIMPIKITSASFSRRAMAKAAVDILCNHIKNKKDDEPDLYIQKIISASLSIGETT